MNPSRYVTAVTLAVSIAWTGSPRSVWGQDDAGPELPAAFAPRPAYLVTDPDEPQAAARAATAIWVRTERPGRLVLMTGSGRVVAADEGEQPVVVHDWRHPATEPVPDTPFRVRFFPDGDALGVERLLRVRAGEPLWRTLHQPADIPGWRLTPAEPDAFAPSPASLAATRPDVIEADAELERELAALLQLEEHPPPTAKQLRENGLQKIVEGEYATALELLEQSLRLKPDAALLDRVERLRRFLDVRRAVESKE